MNLKELNLNIYFKMISKRAKLDRELG